MDAGPTIVRTGGLESSGEVTRQGGEQTEPMAPDQDAPALARGALIDRYVVTDQLGAGGMGVVYAAYDPELDRRVAIKLLRPSYVGEGRPRLVREAQAIARIAHPNVVAVHDVGEREGSVFVTMEFVDGQTLTKWLRAKDRTIPEIVEVFRQAGRGLAAAHEADLVHRDFKPDNVLVGFDGRVRVVDFGLARGRGSAESIGIGRPMISGSSLDEALTEVGTVMGTPAYMSPEQLAGHMATAASDQFAFCVALHEAVYGLRPFEGKTIESLSHSVLSGEVRDPPPGRSVPGWLRRVVLRGLQTRPDDRYPGMESLLADLTKDRGRVRRRWALAGAAGVGALVVAGLAYRSGVTRERSACEGAGDDMRSVWTDDRRQALGAAFGALALPHAEDTWDRVSQRVDAYAQGWRDQSVAACRATHVEQTQSTELLEHRRRCLVERLQRLDAFLDVLAEPTPPVVDRAVQGVLGLPDLEGCRDVAALVAGVAPPEQESTRAEVAALREALTHVEALGNAARYREQLEQLEPLLEKARATGYLPLVAAVEHDLAVAQADLERPEATDNLHQAFRTAIAAGDDRRAAMVAVNLGHALGAEQRLYERGREWTGIAQALVHRMGKGADIEIGITNTQAIMAIRQAHYDEALALFERLVQQQRALDPDSPNLAVALMNLGSAHAERRQFDQASEYLQQAVDHTERVLGPKHPRMSGLYANLGLVEALQGHHAEAEKKLERTLALQREVYGEQTAEYARSLASMAVVQRHLGRPERSEQLHRRALEIRRDKLGPDHPEVTESMRNLALTLLDLDQPRPALELAQQAQQLAHQRLGPDHPEHGYHAAVVAQMLLEVGEPDQARPLAEQAVALLDAHGRGPTASVEARCILGEAQRALGQPDDARATLHQAIERARDPDVQESIRGRCHYELARTLWALDEPAPARAQAEQALALFEAAGAGARRDHQRAQQWLAAHAVP